MVGDVRGGKEAIAVSGGVEAECNLHGPAGSDMSSRAKNQNAVCELRNLKDSSKRSGVGLKDNERKIKRKKGSDAAASQANKKQSVRATEEEVGVINEEKERAEERMCEDGETTVPGSSGSGSGKARVHGNCDYCEGKQWKQQRQGEEQVGSEREREREGTREKEREREGAREKERERRWEDVMEVEELPEGEEEGRGEVERGREEGGRGGEEGTQSDDLMPLTPEDGEERGGAGSMGKEVSRDSECEVEGQAGREEGEGEHSETGSLRPLVSGSASCRTESRGAALRQQAVRQQAVRQQAVRQQAVRQQALRQQDVHEGVRVPEVELMAVVLQAVEQWVGGETMKRVVSDVARHAVRAVRREGRKGAPVSGELDGTTDSGGGRSEGGARGEGGERQGDVAMQNQPRQCTEGEGNNGNGAVRKGMGGEARNPDVGRTLGGRPDWRSSSGSSDLDVSVKGMKRRIRDRWAIEKAEGVGEGHCSRACQLRSQAKRRLPHRSATSFSDAQNHAGTHHCFYRPALHLAASPLALSACVCLHAPIPPSPSPSSSQRWLPSSPPPPPPASLAPLSRARGLRAADQQGKGGGAGRVGGREAGSHIRGVKLVVAIRHAP